MRIGGWRSRTIALWKRTTEENRLKAQKILLAFKIELLLLGFTQAHSFIRPSVPLSPFSPINMDATSNSKFPIDRFPMELRVMVYEMSDPFDTFCTKNEVPWFENKSGCPYKDIPWSRTIFLSSVLNDKDALELASIQTEYRKVKFLEPSGFKFTHIYTIGGDFPAAIFCELIALGGNLPALKWARTYRIFSKQPKDRVGNNVYMRPLPWSERVCSNAAKCGHFGILKWAKGQGCPWDEISFAMVAALGDIQVLKWLKEQGCPFNGRTFYSAAFGGHLEVLKWLHLQHCEMKDFVCADATAGAAEIGQLGILMWLQEQKYPMHAEVMYVAARNGHFHVVKWLHDFMFHEKVFRSYTYPYICATAARTGHLEMLRWLHEHGYPMDKSTTYQAKKRGHSEVFEWAVSQGCPYDEDYSMNSEIEESDSDDDDDESEDQLEDDWEEDDVEQGNSVEDDNDESEDELEDDMEPRNSVEDDNEGQDEFGVDEDVSSEEKVVTSKRLRQG